MILTCPECATRYLIDPAALTPKGRMVRCAKCGESWRELPPADMPKQIEFEAPPIRVRPIPRGSNLPALQRRPKRSGSFAGWAALLVVVLLLAGGAWYARAQIVALWPPAARLYAALDIPVPQQNKLGLDITNLKSAVTEEAGVRVLTVQGEILNVTDEARVIPRLRVVLRNAQGQDVYQWSFAASAGQVKAHGSVPFATRLSGPPGEASNLEVMFAAGGDDRPRS